MANDLDPPPDSLVLRAMGGDIERYRQWQARRRAELANERRRLQLAADRLDGTPPPPLPAPTPPPTGAGPAPTPTPAQDLRRLEILIRTYPNEMRALLAPLFADFMEAWEQDE